MLKLYLDSSVIVKRYIVEPGTETVDIIFDNAGNGENILVFSLWNIGEALGVFDERLRRGWLTKEEFAQSLKNMVSELLKLTRLRMLEIIPTHTGILTETWPIILNHHIYEADALQISTYLQSQSDILLSGDKKLVQVGRGMGLKAFHIVEDEEEINIFIRKDSNVDGIPPQ